MTIKRIGKYILYALLACLVALAIVLLVFRVLAYLRETGDRVQEAPASGHFVHAYDVDIYVQEFGPEGDAPVVLFIAGTGAWSETWRDTTHMLGKVGYHVIAIDLPPFGYSERPAANAYDTPDQAKRILGVLDALHVSRAILVGHSFGSRASMEAVLTHPERFKGVVLVDAALMLDDVSGAASPIVRGVISVPPLRNSITSIFTTPSFTRYFLQSFLASTSIPTDDRVDIYRAPLSLVGTTDAIGNWLTDFLSAQQPSPSTQSAAYETLKVPVTLVWGREDTVTPLAGGEKLKGLIPHAELTVIDGVGHIPQIEAPDAFYTVLVKFLGEHP